MALLVFGLMSLACIQLEGLATEEAERFWDHISSEFKCDEAQEITDKAIVTVFVYDPKTDRAIDYVQVTVIFKFYSSEWSGAADDEGNLLCLRMLQSSETHHEYFWEEPITISSDTINWRTINDIQDIFIHVSKPGYSNYTENISRAYPSGLGGFQLFRSVPLSKLDE